MNVIEKNIEFLHQFEPQDRFATLPEVDGRRGCNVYYNNSGAIVAIGGVGLRESNGLRLVQLSVLRNQHILMHRLYKQRDFAIEGNKALRIVLDSVREYRLQLFGPLD